MSFEDWTAAVQPKVDGTRNLHNILPKNMDFFIFLSSIAGVFGSPGQSNYGAGNSYQDALAQHRVANGQKTISLDLGIFRSAGILADNKDMADKFNAYSVFQPVTEEELLALLEIYCDPAVGLLSPLKCQPVIGVGTMASLRERGVDEAYWMRKAFFRHLYQIDGTNSASSASSDRSTNYVTMYTASSSLAEAGAVVSQALMAKLSEMLSIPVEELDLNKQMHTYGVDSLVAAELRNWFAREWSADVAIFDILGGATPADVGMVAAGKSLHRQAAWME